MPNDLDKQIKRLKRKEKQALAHSDSRYNEYMDARTRWIGIKCELEELQMKCDTKTID